MTIVDPAADPAKALLPPRSAPWDARPDQRADLANAAKAFEAIFVRQILAAARKTEFAGGDNLFGGQAMDTFRQMQDERFAQIAADSGMLGIGRMIAARLAAQTPVSAATAMKEG